MASHSKPPKMREMEDDGCEFHPECLTCPFRECRYDKQLQTQLNDVQVELVSLLRRKGLSIEQIHMRTGIKHRSISRYLAKGKQRGLW